MLPNNLFRRLAADKRCDLDPVDDEVADQVAADSAASRQKYPPETNLSVAAAFAAMPFSVIINLVCL